MSRLLAMLCLLGSIISATGCCCHHFGGGGGACPPAPCGPCGSVYGSYPAYSQAYAAPAYSTAVIPTTVSATACTNCGPGISAY